jgi:sulfite exporter TauE/SafE
LGIGIGVLGGLVSWGMGILAGRATSTAELLTQVLGAVAGIIPIGLVALGIVLSVMPSTRRTGAGILLSFGIGILLAGGVCVALLAGVLVN